ncbi:MAG TPA: molybdopterin-synthase adenylyltransferase MoeB [Polyangia bacterium]|jgi:molybdopterin/thiamine biosynthesis adenylyltransferase/rhodanese-related sulfurtransferase|nr:molybdopterin-synthase adenylyltransferase MoeB [Polyangia bacterium]
MSFGKYLKDVKAQIREVDLDTVRKTVEARQGKGGDGNGAGPILIDVREKDEWSEGFIPGARWIPRGFLELRIEDQIPEPSSEIILYCAGGNRSALAARSLAELGYTNVRSMAGGFSAWKRAGLTFDRPFIMTQEQSLRYARHTMLPEVGETGQVKLLKSKVLCLGAGGLGSPSGLYLAAAGVGTIGFVDDDVVDASNLQRQILHSTDRVGLPKVESARQAIAGLNPDVKVVPHQTRLSSENVLEIIKDYDLIVDGADNFPTRYLLNDAALKLGKPVVHASIYRFEGQVTSFIPHEGPCYRCLYPSPPPADMAPSCQEAGVLGVLCGVIGSLQANEAIKILLGIGKPLAGRLLMFDALGLKFREMKLRRDPTCPTCGEGVKPESIELIDYQEFCNVRL